MDGSCPQMIGEEGSQSSSPLIEQKAQKAQITFHWKV
jgi:hypothetical protein